MRAPEPAAAGTSSAREVFTAAGLRRGFVAAQPLAIGVFVYGVTFGLLAFDSGLSVFEAVLMSATVYSGSAQTATVGALASGAGIVASVATVLLLNARYLLYGAALRPWLGQVDARRAYASLYFLGDGNWLLSMRAYEAGEHDAGYVFGSGVAMFLPWTVGTLLGNVIGLWIPSPQMLALDFLLVAFCAAMGVAMLRAHSTAPALRARDERSGAAARADETAPALRARDERSGAAARAQAPWWPVAAALVAALLADRLAPGGWAIVAAGLAGALAAYLRHDGAPGAS
jgi:4-azaleucine resistance transporter AzlC